MSAVGSGSNTQKDVGFQVLKGMFVNGVLAEAELPKPQKHFKGIHSISPSKILKVDKTRRNTCLNNLGVHYFLQKFELDFLKTLAVRVLASQAFLASACSLCQQMALFLFFLSS